MSLDPWDDDDRVRCICIHLVASSERERCLRSTRHPSQKCGDCREYDTYEEK